MRSALKKVLSEAGHLAWTRKVSHVREKSELDFVTNVDHEVDSWLSKSLEIITPGVPVFSEERSVTGTANSTLRWLIDPLDGTHNFKAGLPFAAVSAALFEGNEAILAGVCHISSGDVYVAERGAGSWRNDERVQIRAGHSQLIAVSSGAIDCLVGQPDLYAGLRKLGKLRNFGAQALHLCYVAQGHLALAVSQEAKLWDDAAGRLIVEEAGGRYLAFGGARFNDEDITRAVRSVCGHPEVIEEAADLFSRIWNLEKHSLEVS